MKVVNTNKQYVIYGDNLHVHDQLPADVYIVRFNQMQGFYMEKYAGLEVNEEVYGVHMSKVKKIMRTFKDFERNLGVMLSGDKGIGKSLFAKVLSRTAIDAGYPVIIVDAFVPGIHSFIEEIEQEVVVLFDEFDKTFSAGNNGGCSDGEDRRNNSAQTSLLSLLDGVSSGKKMFIITCNRFGSLNEFLINRPGRFHYHLRFGYPTAEEIQIYLQDKISKQYWEEIPKVIAFAGKINLNYDCLRAIAYELETGEKFEEAINDLNILNLSDQSYDIALRFTDGTILYRNGYRFDLFSTKPEQMWINKPNGYNLNVEFIPARAKYDSLKGCSVIDGANLKVSDSGEDDDDTEGAANSQRLTAIPEYMAITRTEKNHYHYAV